MGIPSGSKVASACGDRASLTRPVLFLSQEACRVSSFFSSSSSCSPRCALRRYTQQQPDHFIRCLVAKPRSSSFFFFFFTFRFVFSHAIMTAQSVNVRPFIVDIRYSKKNEAPGAQRVEIKKIKIERIIIVNAFRISSSVLLSEVGLFFKIVQPNSVVEFFFFFKFRLIIIFFCSKKKKRKISKVDKRPPDYISKTKYYYFFTSLYIGI